MWEGVCLNVNPPTKLFHSFRSEIRYRKWLKRIYPTLCKMSANNVILKKIFFSDNQSFFTEDKSLKCGKSFEGDKNKILIDDYIPIHIAWIKKHLGIKNPYEELE
jgi:hypothetical protein